MLRTNILFHKEPERFAAPRITAGERRRRAARAGTAVAIFGAILASIVLGGSPAYAAPRVACGSTLTTSVTLTADLTCPSGKGLVLGSNVTLDLGGHKLVGPGASGLGVQMSTTSTGGNTIRNGTIQNWGTGILLEPWTEYGTASSISDLALLKAPVTYRYSNGIKTLTMTRVTAVDSAISSDTAGDIAIVQSRLTRSPVNVFFASATITKTYLSQSSVDSSAMGEIVIDGSYLNGQGVSALGSVSETRITIKNSTVKNYKQPITGFWGAVTLTKNTFTDMPNGVLGDVAYNIGIDATSYIVGNTFTRSGVALRGNVPMIVEKNTFTQGKIGVEFTRIPPFEGEPPFTASDSRAVGNTFSANTGSGITTKLRGLKVGSNTATKNGGYGIYAPGAVDLGRNIASGNTLGQCVGVVCTAK
ncbi:MAG: right-handed parallel beta-helix repeat-containing protein [Mycetocola sp.]